MARVFKFIDALGYELHTISDPQDDLPIPKTMQMISIGQSTMTVESVISIGTDSIGTTVYEVRVREIPFIRDQSFKN
jgi:hypothetical protein